VLRREDRTRAVGLPDLLRPDALIRPDVVLQDDGSLLCAWRYTGPDLEASEPEYLNQLVRRFNNAMLQLGSGWMINCDVIRSADADYPVGGAFPDPVTRAIDAERHDQFTAAGSQYRSEYFVALSYLPPAAFRADSWLTGQAGDWSDATQAILRRFDEGVRDFEGVFSSLFLVDRLSTTAGTSELLRYLHRCIVGISHPLRVPPGGVLLNEILGSVPLVDRERPRIGSKHIRVIAIDGFPEFTTPGMLAQLDQLRIAYRWSTRMILQDTFSAVADLEVTRKKRSSQKRGFFAQIFNMAGEINQDAADMEKSVRDAKTLAESQTVRFGSYTGCVVLMDEDPASLEESVPRILGVIRNNGFACRDEDYNTLEAYLGTIPGNGWPNVRRFPLHSANAACLMPITSIWTGHATNPCGFLPDGSPALMRATTTGATTFRLNLHVQDVGNTLIAGPVGTGKSTFLGVLCAQWFRYPNAQVFFFDRDLGAWMLTHAVGGKHYDIGSGEMQFAPLHNLDTLADREWAASYLEDLCVLSGLPVTPRHRNAISKAVELLAAGRDRTMTAAWSEIQDEDIRCALEHYTLQGMAGSLLDAPKDSFSLGASSRMVTFETASLLKMAPRTALPVLLYLFRRVEQRLDGSPTLLVLDEAWAYLAHEVFRGKLAEWLLTFRKKNTSVVIATQTLSHIADSPISRVILEECWTKILLPNAEAMNPDSKRIYVEAVGLTDREVELVATGIPKQDYYVRSSEGRRMITLALGKVALAFCAVNGQEDRARVARLMAEYPEGWRAEWLRERGLPRWADYFERKEERKLCVVVSA
jgi:type IV secretion system protein TrbE